MLELTLTARANTPAAMAQQLREIAHNLEQGHTEGTLVTPSSWYTYQMEPIGAQPIQQFFTPEEQANQCQVFSEHDLTLLREQRGIQEEVEAGDVEVDFTGEGTNE